KLENITGFRIVMDKIQTHERTDGTPEEDKTDMYIHAENRETNEVIASDILLKAIDAHGGMILTQLMNRYNILEIVPTSSQPEESKEVEKLTMALILVGILLAIPCLLLAVILYTVHKKYKRKLKAASAMNYGSDITDHPKLELPNTNQYAYEKVLEVQTRF
ncbi:hypothetical protein ScPMuIL_003767, partial [Solemya velum]